MQGEGGPDAADTWALQLLTDPPQTCNTPATLKHDVSRWSRHSAAVCDFTMNHPSQQAPQIVPPGRAKDLLVVSPANSPLWFVPCCDSH